MHLIFVVWQSANIFNNELLLIVQNFTICKNFGALYVNAHAAVSVLDSLKMESYIPLATCLNLLLVRTYDPYTFCILVVCNIQILIFANFLIIKHFQFFKIICDCILENRPFCHISYFEKYRFKILNALCLSCGSIQSRQVSCINSTVI